MRLEKVVIGAVELAPNDDEPSCGESCNRASIFNTKATLACSTAKPAAWITKQRLYTSIESAWREGMVFLLFLKGKWLPRKILFVSERVYVGLNEKE